jgi:hypothetical protein
MDRNKELRTIVNCRMKENSPRRPQMRTPAAAAALIVLICAAAPDAGAAPPVRVVALTLKDHRFSPSEIAVRAGERIRIELTNLDGASEEFDSVDLGIEVDVTPHGKASFDLGPLKPGRYAFMGELHPETAGGRIEVSD